MGSQSAIHQLNEQISFCDIAGRIVFLDIANDRYFQLPSKAEEAFRTWIAEGDCCCTDIGDLARAGILVEVSSDSLLPAPLHPPPAERSSLEQAWSTERHPGPCLVLEVFAIVLLTLIELQVTTLKGALDRLVSHRRRCALSPSPCLSANRELEVSLAATMFRKARVLAPIQPSCLLDSIALVKFLSARNHHANIVFGVTIDPFSAHCWVQAGSLALNDHAGNVNSYMPIRTV